MEPSVYIFTGHYGSGKTEVAVNYALYLKKNNPDRKVAIVDMDIVNPFFRTADALKQLTEAGVFVELPMYANTNIDVPALTASMGGLIEDKNCDVVLDIGGDDVGAKAVGRYSDLISARGYKLYFVMNYNRPFTRNIQNAGRMFDDISAASCLPITGLVNNTNLLQYTTPQTVLDGIPLINELSKLKNVPVVMCTAFEEIAEQIKNAPELSGVQLLPMKEHIKLLWNRDDENQ